MSAAEQFYFLDEPIAPSFERQRELYRQIAASLVNRPLVIRTLDLGGDKQPAFLGPQFEANPNLGIQGLRFSLLASQELFRTQIRALLHVGKDYDVRIMLPMVLGGADLRHAIAIMREVAGEERYATGASPCRHFRVDWYPARFSCVGSDPAGLMQLHRGIDGCR